MNTDQVAGLVHEQAADGTTGVFLCYRRGDKEAGVGRLYDRLVNRFGKARVFRDIDAVRPAADFVAEIDRALARSGVLIAIIGPRWLTLTDERGRPRIDDPADFVRFEIEKALKSATCHVLPVLRGGAEMPAPEELPESLRRLAHLQAIEIDDDQGAYFEFDAQRVIDAVSSIIERGPQLAVELADHELSVEPGQSASATVCVRNTGPTPATINLSVEGPPWATLHRDSGTVPAHGELRVTLEFRPPRAPELTARPWPFRVLVGQSNGSAPQLQADGSVATSAFFETYVQLTPDRVETRREATFSLVVTNAGNIRLGATVGVAGDGLHIGAPERIELGPGERQEAPVVARPLAPRLARRSSDHTLSVTLTTDEEPEPIVRRATVRVKPRLPVGAGAALLLVGALVAGVGGTLVFRPADAGRLPDVTALNGVEATAQLRDAGFTHVTVTQEQTSAEPAGEVLRTLPAPGTNVRLDDAISLVVATPANQQLELPDVTPMSQNEALKTLADAGFTKVSVTKEVTTKEPRGEVLRTVPGPGTTMQPDTPISVIVADTVPVKLYTIPDVTGLTWSEALGVLPGPLDIFKKDESSDSVPNGQVIRTDPAIGTKHRAGTNVTLYISTGPSTTADCVFRSSSLLVSCTGFKPSEPVSLLYGEYIGSDRQMADGNGAVTFDVSALLSGSAPGSTYDLTATGQESGRSDTVHIQTSGPGPS